MEPGGRRRSILSTVAVACCLVVAIRTLTAQVPGPTASGPFAADLAARRSRTMDALGEQTVLVLWSAPPRVYSADIEYPYRQESNLLYLSGIAQPETVLVLVPSAKTSKALLFVRRPDLIRALWFGRALESSEVTAISGIRTVLVQQQTEVFDGVMDALLSGRDQTRPEFEPGEFATFSDAIRQGRARLAVLGRLSDRDVDAGLGRDADQQVAWARSMEAQHPGVTAVTAASLLRAQRHVKTAYEQAVLRQSVEISAEAHLEAMRATRPGAWEYQIKAALEYAFLMRGALTWGYPPIVGSGPNATTLHYLEGTRQLKDGELLLVDAAASYQHLTGDITRTWPVNGHFSPTQRAVYDAVLRAQEAGIAAARPGRSVREVSAEIRAVIGEGLARLGLVRAEAGEERETQIGLWFPHDPIHGIGLDVHEPIETLDPGSAFVIEPGIYVRSDALARLPKTPANQAFIDAVTPVVDRYRDIGVRIEDSFVMSATGPEMLSGRVPRSAAAVEAAVGQPR